MFNIEQFPINREFAIMSPNEHGNEIEDKLSNGIAVYFLIENNAYLFTPKDSWMIKNHHGTLAKFVSDKPGLISSILPYPRHIENFIERFAVTISKTERPIVFEEDGLPVGYCLLSDLLQYALMEQFYLRAYFFSLSETVTDAVTVVDKNGTVICWNTPAEEMYGIPKDEIIGCRIGEHFEPEALMVLKILDEGRTLRKAYHTPQPGKHVLINASPILRDGRDVIGSIAAEQDITHLVKLNEELSSVYTFKAEDTLPEGDPFNAIRGRSPKIEKAVVLAKKIAMTDSHVLLAGEPGVGKERFSHLIHGVSRRSDHPLLSVNCGAIPAGMLEAELFGYQSGTFTGNEIGKAGKLELAHHGTLYLEEIDKLPPDLQFKLYQFIQNHTITRYGGDSPIELKTRIIASTNKDLLQLVKSGSFRNDLYYAISVASIHIPPLRERKEDIPEMVQFYLRAYASQYQKPIPQITPEVILAIMNYDWPGNVRELRSVIERSVIISENEKIALDQLPLSFQHEQPHLELETDMEGLSDIVLKPKITSDEEIHHIEEALRKTFGNKSAAAKLLGISRGTLYNKMREYSFIERE